MKSKLLLFVLALFLFGNSCLAADAGKKDNLSLQLVRNATLKLSSGGTTFLIDPMFAEVGAYEGFPDTYRSWLPNPLTPLPLPVEEILADVDGVILTHTHLDHWDEAAQKAIPKDLPVFVQNEADAALVRSQGFKNVQILGQSGQFGNVKLQRTACRHGSEAMYADPQLAKALGEVMGLVFTAKDGKKVYVAADTVWFKGVDEAIAAHRPDVIVLNTGGAALSQDKFKDDPEIIMGQEDVLKAVQGAPDAAIVAVHMDAINHMTVDRKDLSQYARKRASGTRFSFPLTGRFWNFKLTGAPALFARQAGVPNGGVDFSG